MDEEGYPLRIYIPKEDIEFYDKICAIAYESGVRFREQLQREYEEETQTEN